MGAGHARRQAKRAARKHEHHLKKLRKSRRRDERKAKRKRKRKRSNIQAMKILTKVGNIAGKVVAVPVTLTQSVVQGTKGIADLTTGVAGAFKKNGLVSTPLLIGGAGLAAFVLFK
jgi:hypothetical protein